MLTSFNLTEDCGIDQFCSLLENFSMQLIGSDLLQLCGPVGKRVQHPVMDTETRNFTYFFLMSFSDRAQCDRAVEHIYARGAHSDPEHAAILGMLSDSTFVCWQDLDR